MNSSQNIKGKWSYIFPLFIPSNIANYTDSTTLFFHVQKKKTKEYKSTKLLKIFHNNCLKKNSSKSDIMLKTDYSVKGSLEKKVKPLGITRDNKHSFEPHLNEVYKKISQIIHVLAK